MPRYHFHRYDNRDVFDIEGREMADLQAAHAFALNNAREIASDPAQAGRVSPADRIDITDDDGRRLNTVNFGEALGAGS